jgi:hypothetical protein
VIQFELDELANVMNAGDVNDALKRYAETQAAFYPASPNFIELDKQSVLQNEIDLFLSPRAVPRRLDPRLYESFSFTAWVDGPPKTPLWIVRKTQQSVTESTSSDVCWGWQFPGCFAFGQHDAALGNFQEGRPAAETVCTDAEELPGMNLESMVVNGTHAHFYRNGVLLSATPLSRKVTDCDGSIEVGDKGLRLGKGAPPPALVCMSARVSHTNLTCRRGLHSCLLPDSPCDARTRRNLPRRRPALGSREWRQPSQNS